MQSSVKIKQFPVREEVCSERKCPDVPEWFRVSALRKTSQSFVLRNWGASYRSKFQEMLIPFFSAKYNPDSPTTVAMVLVFKHVTST